MDDAPPGARDLSARGPYAAGVTTARVDASKLMPTLEALGLSPFFTPEVLAQVRDLEVEVWYPADPAANEQAKAVYDLREWMPEADRSRIPADAPTTFTMEAVRDAPLASDGKRPVVLFSHGLGGYRTQTSFLTTHLASWGFIVLAPEHTSRNLGAVLSQEFGEEGSDAQMLAALAWLAAENDRAESRFNGEVDLDQRGVMGHSQGGYAVQELVDGGFLDADAWVAMASFAAPAADIPGLMMGGTADDIAMLDVVEGGFEKVPGTKKRFVAIEGAGHLAFSDICVIGRERGGLLQIAADAGFDIGPLVLRLGQDGCRPADLKVEEAWPVVRYYVTQHLQRALMGLPADEALPAALESLVADERTP